MNITFSSLPGSIYDFIMSAIFVYSNSYVEDYFQLNLVPDKNVEEAIDRIRRRITVDFKGADLFLSNEAPAIEAFIRNEDIWGKKSIEEYLDYLNSFDEFELKIKVLRFLYDNKDIEDTFLENIINDNTSTIDFISNLKVEKSVKWEVYQFIQSPLFYINELSSFLKDYLKVYNSVMKEYLPTINSFNKYIDNNLKDKGVSFLIDLTKRKLELNEGDLYVTTMFFNSHSFSVSHRENGVYFLIGIDCEETIRKLYGEGEIENNLNIFKSLSDPTRFEILRMVSEKEMYGQEFADRLGITMASITYHMNFLLGTDIVKVRPVGRKIYYSLNKETIKKGISFLNNIFNL